MECVRVFRTKGEGKKKKNYSKQVRADVLDVAVLATRRSFRTSSCWPIALLQQLLAGGCRTDRPLAACQREFR